ncbi:hypothetical protein KY284_028660 [Solanum tuberosum]|nr:hypothetical protein KY284_028660 [Solanum tuberosum]
MTGLEEEAPANSVPAAAVRRGGQVFFGMTGRKGARRRGEIRRSTKERQKRRQLSGSLPTLRCESMGSEQD